MLLCKHRSDRHSIDHQKERGQEKRRGWCSTCLCHNTFWSTRPTSVMLWWTFCRNSCERRLSAVIPSKVEIETETVVTIVMCIIISCYYWCRRMLENRHVISQWSAMVDSCFSWEPMPSTPTPCVAGKMSVTLLFHCFTLHFVAPHKSALYHILHCSILQCSFVQSPTVSCLFFKVLELWEGVLCVCVCVCV